MALFTAYLPDIEEICPEYLYQFLDPDLACFSLGSFAFSIILLLIIDDGLRDASLQEVSPTDRLLMARLVSQRVGSGNWELLVWIAEPLNKVLGDECSKRLGGVAGVIEIVQRDGQESVALCFSIWVWATQ